MQIDWFTVGAQIVNFLVLVYLLKRFLYQPILDLMSQRERKIMGRQKLAENKMRSAEKTIHRYLGKQKELNAKQAQILNQARRAAEHEHTILLGKLRDEIDDKRLRWQAELNKEQASLMQEVGSVVGKKIITICRQVLRDLAGTPLEQQIVHRFLDELDRLSETDKRKVLAETSTDGNVIVATGFELNQRVRGIVRDKLSRLTPGVEPEFQLRPELVCGVVLETSEQIWSWNVGDYLDELNEAISDATLFAGAEEVKQ